MDSTTFSFSKGLAAIDNVCDYIPIVSSLTNLTDLFMKYVMLPKMHVEDIENDYYYTHLMQKDNLRYILLSVPLGIGNLLVGIYDFYVREWNDKEFVINSVRQQSWHLAFASLRLL